MRREFGCGLADEGVHVLDPFAGTGSYMAQLVSDPGLIPLEDLPRKYRSELHSNEILLLAYYIMVVNVEYAYHSRTGGAYEPFTGAVLTDTFQMHEEGDQDDLGIFASNTERVMEQKRTPITVIVGNPPYSVGQRNANDDNQNSGKVSLQGLFDGTFSRCQVPDDARGIVSACVRGGWPEAIEDFPERSQAIARDYLELVFTESVPNLRRNGDTARRLVASIVRNLGQATTYQTLIGDMYGAESNPEEMISKQTVAEYLSMLVRMYLVEELRGWEPASRSKKRLVTRPKRYLADPSLAVAMLGMSADSLLADWQTFGLVFENLCLRDLRVYAGALKGAGSEPLRYYRDDAGLEVDFVIELADGRWAAIEAKTGESKVPEAIESLKRLKRKVVSDDPRARVRDPEFMAVVTATSPYAREVEDGIYVVPIRALGR